MKITKKPIYLYISNRYIYSGAPICGRAPLTDKILKTRGRRPPKRMKIKDLESQVSILHLAGSAGLKTEKQGNVIRIRPCPICGGGMSEDGHFTIYPETNSYSSFAACCSGGGPYRWLMEVEKMSEEEARNELERLAGDQKIEIKKAPPATMHSEEETKADNQAFIQSYHECKDFSYFISRGIPKDLVDKYKLSISTRIFKGEKRAIFPIWKNGQIVQYTGRALDESKPRYKNGVGSLPIWNAEKASSGDIIITEGILDALSLEAQGFTAIALSGTKTNIAQELINANPKARFYIMADNDEGGQRLAKGLKNVQRLTIPSEYKDPNEWHIADRNMRVNVKAQMNAPDSLALYATENLQRDIEAFSAYKDRKTGFEYLDEKMIFASGLYILGGVPTLGKTTFVYQLADQLASKGEHVLFFSLEMSKLELITKSVARRTAKRTAEGYQGIRARMMMLDALTPQETQDAQDALNAFIADTGGRLSVIEGTEKTTPEYISRYVEAYIEKNGIRPFVILDYLQITPAESNRENRERVEETIATLKRAARDLKCAILVISSLNRANYNLPIGYESFKESGGIEYTADAVLALQLQAINDDLFNKNGEEKKKRERIEDEKKAIPRHVELVALKYRGGISSFKTYFDYYPHLDLFINTEKPAIKYSIFI